jgi:hypothetical protein
MSQQQQQQSTQVKQVDMGFIDEMFAGTATADNIIHQEDKKPGIFSTGKPDLSYLDNPPKPEKPAKPEDKPNPDANANAGAGADDKPVLSKEELDNILDINPEADNQGGEGDNRQGGSGRPKTDKSGLVNTFKKLIEDEKIFAFEDDKPIEEYTEKDFIELLDANFAEKERILKEKTPVEFFESLPKEMQYAAKYIADGGTDLKGLFNALGRVEEVKALDITNEVDQERIIRTYLTATKFGDEKEINEEIQSWKDLGKLEAKAKGFKPKLDQMQEAQVQATIAQQEATKKKQKEAGEKFVDNVYTALKTGEINNLKLDKKTQAGLYAGLTQATYPSVSGKQTNLLGHLLEKYQFVEPNFALVTEALWLLSNPEGYRAELLKQGKTAATEETVRQLKTAQAQKTAGGSGEVDDNKRAGANGNQAQRRLDRPTNIFARPK